jgi:OmpA-OmpF porin, OOP family
MRIFTTLLTVVTLFICSHSDAQINTTLSQENTKTNAKHNGLEVGLLGGTLFYTGETHCERFLLKNTNFGGGGFLRYNFSDQFATRLNLIGGQIAGDDANFPRADRGDRNFSFKSNVFDVNAILEWEPLGKRRYTEDNRFKRILSPYLTAGVGLLMGKPKTNYNETVNVGAATAIAADKADTKSMFFNIPFGAGLRYDLSRNLTLGVEGAFRKPFSDYIDGISKAGNADKGDWYYTGMLNLGYRMKYKRDGDGDGVTDEEDVCPTEPGIAAAKGCPDRDGDGVIDRLDNCPMDRGIVSLGGCPDRDGDRIADKDDACPDQPGEAAYAGCPDRDGDGIIDGKDDCPDAKGSIAFDGCPDTDGDGIADKDDACPREKGSRADNGCPPKDVDGDGIVDKDDLCPDKAGTKENNGCPAVAAVVTGSTSSSSSNIVTSTTTTTNVVSNGGLEISPDAKVVGTYVDNTSVVRAERDVIIETGRVQDYVKQDIPAGAIFKGNIDGGSVVTTTTFTSEDNAVFDEALYGIEFETGSAIIKASSYSVLNKVYQVMSRRGDFNFEISGHTDNVGDENANQRLSEARAKAVFTYLTKKGIAANRLTPRGYGSSNPVADNGTGAGRAKNRRVQFNVQ